MIQNIFTAFLFFSIKFVNCDLQHGHGQGMDVPWISRRSPVYATHGMIACSQPLAAEAGLSILRKGGNAVDAAVAVAAALNVIQPTSGGLGGDAFFLYYDAATKKVQGLNGSGRCPRGLSIEKLETLGYSEQNRPPSTSPLFVTVPGAAAAWVDGLELFGSGNFTLAEILQPAIALAEDGYPVSQVTAFEWAASEQLLQTASPNGFEMLRNGRAPQEGEIMKIPTLATTFKELATKGKAGFYEGRIAEAIVEAVEHAGGIMSLEDLASHFSTQDEPISINYNGIDIYEMPPNGQGLTALVALNILEGFNIASLNHNSALHLHLVIESLRLAFADTRFYIGDPAFGFVPTEELISKEYASERRALINVARSAPDFYHGIPPVSSSTVYFSVVDKDGNACSFINSNYAGFGTGIVPEGCGFTLHNRGDNFSLDKHHANKLKPMKRPYHTIIPGMALKDGELFANFGVMGGFMQPQGHLQVISNMVDFGMNPQEALDAPRVQIMGGTAEGQIQLEEGISEETRQQLKNMGHKDPVIKRGWDRRYFGTGQIIKRDPSSGVLCAGSDPRNDGHAI